MTNAQLVERLKEALPLWRDIRDDETLPDDTRTMAKHYVDAFASVLSWFNGPPT